MHRLSGIIAAAAIFTLPHSTADRSAQQELPHVLLRTELGEIEIEIDIRHASATSANFLRYVDGGQYSPGRFYRTVTPDNQPDDDVRIEVIQGGTVPDRELPRFPAIELERTSVTGLSHLDGTMSMARNGPDTARSEFFICVGDQPELDFGGRRNPDGQGFAAFGRVVRGMDVVRRIQRSPRDGQRLRPPIEIQDARRLPSAGIEGDPERLRALPEPRSSATKQGRSTVEKSQ